MSQPAHAAPKGDFVKKEPVIAAHIAAWVVLNLGVLLVSRYHVLTAQQWSGASVEVTGIVTAGVLALMGWLIRRVVTPAWNIATIEAATFGITLPGGYFGGLVEAQPVGPTAPMLAGQPIAPLDTSAADAALAAAAAAHPMATPSALENA